MTRLNVRCCCQPTKIFGTLEVPDHVAHGGFFEVILRPDIEDNDGPPIARPRIERIEVRQIMLRRYLCKEFSVVPLPSETEYAVYSEERPIEFWRKLYGFREGDRVGQEVAA